MKQIKLLFIILICVFSYTRENKKNIPIENDPSTHFEEIIFNWTRTFAQTIDIAHKKHYKIDDLEESMIKAIDGFVSSLDAHSSLLDPKTYKEVRDMMSGEFFGIGIVIDNMRKKKDKHIIVIDTIPDGPADKAGILPMDKIVEIDNQTLENLPTEKLIARIKGERNTKVNIKIMRDSNSDLLSFDVVRDIVKEQHSLSFYIKNHDIAYISLSMFTESAAKQLNKLLEKSQSRPLRGIIIDLRNNSGGLLTSAIEIAGLFVKKGSLVAITKDKNDKETERYSTTRNPIAHNSVPLFILINNYTASAGEILAGTLKIHSDATNDFLAFLIGTKTFGKGSVQEVIPIGNDCAIKITTHLYFLPNDTTIQGVGIAPDFVVERTTPPTEQLQWFIKHYGHENRLDHYIKVHEESSEKSDQKANNVPKKTTTRYDRAKDMLQKDNQLRDCIMLINMLHSAKNHTPELVKTRSQALIYLNQNYVNTDTLTIEEIKP
jgi:carboxyl-terminal processing protease